MSLRRQLWAQILTKLHEPKMDSTLFFNPFQVVHMNFATKNLLACLHSASSTVEWYSLFGKFVPSNSKPNKPNFYVYNLFGDIWCWLEWGQAISMCFHTFDRDKYKQLHLVQFHMIMTSIRAWSTSLHYIYPPKNGVLLVPLSENYW